MNEPTRIEATEIDVFLSLDTVGDATPDRVILSAADEHWVAPGRTGQPSARCSLWCGSTPRYREERVGLIGHFDAESPQAGQAILEAACRRLADKGCTLAVGPMDGSTWMSYRLVTDRGPAPRFFLEPDNPDFWPGCFADRGFAPIASYFSAVAGDLDRRDPRIDRALERMGRAGVELRSIDLDDFEAELDRLYEVASEAFTDAFLYTSLSRERFRRLYLPLRPLLHDDLIVLATLEGRTVGFVFAVPDHCQPLRGEAIDTAIVKTVAISSSTRLRGLGTLLVALAHDRARRRGFRRVIHALMHEDNISRNISARSATPMRRYGLWARKLGGAR